MALNVCIILAEPTSSTMGGTPTENSPLHAPPPSKLTGRIYFATFLLYLFQSIACSIFESLYPVLYGQAGFSPESLSFLRFGAVPWCLKFIVGVVFQTIVIMPVWGLVTLQFVCGVLILVLSWIPLEDVYGAAILYFFSSCITVISDTAFDGYMIGLYSNSPGTLSAIQVGSLHYSSG